MKTTVILLSLTLSACTASIKSVDTSKAQPECTRQCSQSYSQCVSTPTIGFSVINLHNACKDAFEVCIGACPTNSKNQ